MRLVVEHPVMASGPFDDLDRVYVSLCEADPVKASSHEETVLRAFSEIEPHSESEVLLDFRWVEESCIGDPLWIPSQEADRWYALCEPECRSIRRLIEEDRWGEWHRLNSGLFVRVD